jgi:ABC-type multidrug transport system permease subunit
MAHFDRERGEGIIGVVPWIISRRISRSLLEDIITPFIFSAIYYFLTGLDATATKFFTFFGIMALEHYIAVSFALLSTAVSRDFSVACLFANLIFTFQSFSGGYFIQAATLPVYVRWMKWIAYTVSVFHPSLSPTIHG